MEFRKLNWHIKDAIKKMFMVKDYYMVTTNNHINQRLANLINNDQLLIWNKTQLLKYKSIYLTSKA